MSAVGEKRPPTSAFLKAVLVVSNAPVGAFSLWPPWGTLATFRVLGVLPRL
jgi:hypothetical protein